MFACRVHLVQGFKRSATLVLRCPQEDYEFIRGESLLSGSGQKKNKKKQEKLTQQVKKKLFVKYLSELPHIIIIIGS